MKNYYELIINGNEQKVLGKVPTKDICINVIKEWLSDGRLKTTDKVVIRTTIIIEDEISFIKL